MANAKSLATFALEKPRLDVELISIAPKSQPRRFMTAVLVERRRQKALHEHGVVLVEYFRILLLASPTVREGLPGVQPAGHAWMTTINESNSKQ